MSINIIPSAYAQTSDIESNVSGFFAFSDIGSLTSSLVSAALIAASIAALIYMIYGGISWITSGGDPTKLEAAQKQITNAVIGLIIVAASYAIFLTIKTFLGLDDAIITR